jgi:hypothetical protein
VPDLRGHGQSGILAKPFRHRDAAIDMLALLDHLKLRACIKAKVLVSSTPYFPTQARPITHRYADNIPEQQWEVLRGRHPGGNEQIRAILAAPQPLPTAMAT